MSSFLRGLGGGFRELRGMNQDRFDNQYRQRILDLDERTLDEKTRQFNLAQSYSDRVLAEEKRQFDEETRQFNENLALNKQTTQTNRMLAETGQSQEARLQQKQDKLFDQEEATNQAKSDLSAGFISSDGTGLADKFFTTDAYGRLQNKNRIIDYLNTQTGALIAETGEGLKDMEIVGFEVAEIVPKSIDGQKNLVMAPVEGRRLLLRRKDGSDPNVVPATENATDDPNDKVLEMTMDELKGAVRYAYKTQTLDKIDGDKLDLNAYAAANLMGEQRLGQEEKAIQDAVTAKAMEQGKAAPIRYLQKRLIETQNDPEGRQELLETVGLDPAQFAQPADPRDPNKEFLGPDTLITDPLEGKYAISDADIATAGVNVDGSNPFIGGKKGRFQTENKNLVSRLQKNFEEQDQLLTTTQTTEANRTQRLGELEKERKELLDPKVIHQELSSRKAVREAYKAKLEKQNMSPNQRNAELEKYDAYIAQLENYLPKREQEVVNIGTAVGQMLDKYTVNGKLDEAKFSAALAAGELPITEQNVAAVQEYFVEQDVKDAVDLRKQSLTAQFTAYGIIAATATTAQARTNAFDAIRNLTATGQDISIDELQDNQLEAEKAAETRAENLRVDRRAQDARDDKAREDFRADVEKVNEVGNAVASHFVVRERKQFIQKLPGETNAQYEKRMAEGFKAENLVQKAGSFWTGDGGGRRAFALMQDESLSKTARDSADNVFMNAGRSTVVALLASKDENQAYEEDFLEFFGTEYDPSVQPIFQQNISMQDIIVEMKGPEGKKEVNRFRVARPEGGYYEGAVPAKFLKQKMGADAYGQFVKGLRDRQAIFTE
mgnify:CR=1 FL=1